MRADEKLTAFLELESAIKTRRHNHECDCPEPDEELGSSRRQSHQSRLELSCVSAIDSNGRTIWIADAHCGDGKRYVVRADEKLTAFLELEAGFRAISNLGRSHTAKSKVPR